VTAAVVDACTGRAFSRAARTEWRAFHEAGHVVVAWSRGFETLTQEFQRPGKPVDPLRGIRFDAGTSVRAREQAESAIVVWLAGPEAQRTHSPRSWRFRHGAADFKRAVDLASGFNGSDEAVRAYLDWLAIVTRDEIAALWPHVEKVAQALVTRRTLTASEIKTLLASQ
jgi:hypothetical protein